jgi:hypothetical protein
MIGVNGRDGESRRAMSRCRIRATSIAALLSTALPLVGLLGACESGGAPEPGARSQGAVGTLGEKPSNGGDLAAEAANAGASSSSKASSSKASEGNGTRVALDTAGAAASAGAAPDAGLADGGRETSDSGASDAGISDAAIAPDAAPLPSNDCCSTSSSGGCNDPLVSACVCEGDPACCGAEYDDICVTQAVSRCGQRCDERPPVSDCCSPSDVPSCSVPEVAACVCAIDPFCCVFRFDQNCVNLGLSQCNAACGEEAQP